MSHWNLPVSWKSGGHDSFVCIERNALQQTTPTEKTMEKVNTFLDYMTTHPDAIIRYYPSDMVLNIHSDASYLTAPAHGGAGNRQGRGQCLPQGDRHWTAVGDCSGGA